MFTGDPLKIFSFHVHADNSLPKLTTLKHSQRHNIDEYGNILFKLGVAEKFFFVTFLIIMNTLKKVLPEINKISSDEIKTALI